MRLNQLHLLGLILLSILIPRIGSSQHVVCNNGGVLQANSGSVSYTIGETIILTFTNEGKTITQGFNQPTEQISSKDTIPGNPEDLFHLYPNPANAFSTIAYSGLNGYKYEIYDPVGRLVSGASIPKNVTEHHIDISDLAAADYIILLTPLTGETIALKLAVIH